MYMYIYMYYTLHIIVAHLALTEGGDLGVRIQSLGTRLSHLLYMYRN